ncbi:MAG TPA: DNA translocase FtsK 4TM domain-containing protein, partial [Terrimesophilobacter sp.]|nr:DNA translocase FtsK 4TM domain-containing protein [Terrimesophilobacter sp.]
MASRSTTSTRSRSTGSRARTQPTKRLPAKKAAPPPERSVLASVWMGLAHLVGGAARFFGRETLEKDQLRDGVPFLIFLLAIAGALVEWIRPHDPIAIALDAYTFGGLLGRVAFALPLIMLVLAVWLFRHPPSVDDNGRLGIGLAIMLVSISVLCHVFGGQPPWGSSAEQLAQAGGIVGLVIGGALVTVLTVWVTVPLVAVILLLSLFIITKTPPNRLGRRLHELYAYLFGAQLPDEETTPTTKASETNSWSLGELGLTGTDSLPWWRRNKSQREVDPAFDSALVADKPTELIDRTPKEEFGIELLEDLLKAEDAVKR